MIHAGRYRGDRLILVSYELELSTVTEREQGLQSYTRRLAPSKPPTEYIHPTNEYYIIYNIERTQLTTYTLVYIFY